MAAVVDVILPALDEAGAVPGVLAAMPAGYRPIVVDNGSSDGTGRIAAELGATVVEEPERGFGAAAAAGLAAATAEIACFMDCDGSFDPRELPQIVAPLLAAEADLVLGARRARPGAWPLHARLANRALVRLLARAGGPRLEDLGPMRAARTADLRALGLRDRRFGYPLEMVLAAQRAGWRIGEVPVAYHPRIGRSKVTGTVGGTVRAVADMSRLLRESEAASRPTLIVIAKAPAPGRSKTRLCPPCTPEQAARIAEAALADTLQIVAAVPAARRVLVLEGRPGEWLPEGFEVVPQVAGSLDVRIAAALATADGPALLIGMDTPQLRPEQVSAALAILGTPGTDAVLGASPDGGYWAIGLRDPANAHAAIAGVPMSDPATAVAQRAQIERLGLRLRELGPLRDVDLWADALAVAQQGPAGTFAPTVAAIAASQA